MQIQIVRIDFQCADERGADAVGTAERFADARRHEVVRIAKQRFQNIYQPARLVRKQRCGARWRGIDQHFARDRDAGNCAETLVIADDHALIHPGASSTGGTFRRIDCVAECFARTSHRPIEIHGEAGRNNVGRRA